MEERQHRETLRFILETLKQQAIFLDRQYAWIVALAETIKSDPELEARLQQHPLYDLGPEPRLRNFAAFEHSIDALIRLLSQ
jgi:hypothetical protein